MEGILSYVVLVITNFVNKMVNTKYQLTFIYIITGRVRVREILDNVIDMEECVYKSYYENPVLSTNYSYIYIVLIN